MFLLQEDVSGLHFPFPAVLPDPGQNLGGSGIGILGFHIVVKHQKQC